MASTIEALQPGEFDELLAGTDAYYRRRSPRTRHRELTAILLLHDCAMRIGDAVSVRPEDFNREATEVKIYDGKHRSSKEYDTLPVTHRVADQMFRYERHRIEGSTLLTTSEGAAVWQQHYRRLLANMGVRILGYPVGPHMLRHTVLTELAVDLGVPLSEVQKFARHRHLSSTEKYLHVRPTWMSGIREALSRGV